MSYYLLGQALSYLVKRYCANSLHFISTIPTNLRFFFFFFLLASLLPFIFNVTILTKKRKRNTKIVISPIAIIRSSE